MPRSRTETWLALVALAVGLLLTALGGLWVYMSATATPLHPDAQSAPSRTGADPAPEWTEAVARGRQVLRSALSEHNLPGLSVAVGAGGAIVWTEAFGWADLEDRVALTPDHRLRIGTASVALTAAAAGLLLERGRLKLDDEIQTHVPEFPKKEWPVTLRQLMAHVAGLRTDSGDEGPLFSRHCERPAEAVPSFAEAALLFEPGTQYRYSSYGWILISAAIEAAAATPFLTFMQEQVFDPLGMRDTRPESATKPLESRSTFYFPRFAADPRYGPDVMRDLDLSCYSGASVFLSTPSDLVRFGLAMRSGTLLQPATVQLLQTSQRLSSGAETGYGLGWDVETVSLMGDETRAVGHDGESLGGPVASLMTLPERGIVVAVMSNISYAETFAMASQIAEAFARHNRPAEP